MIRVILVGGLCQTVHPSILDLIEELDMVVIDDDIYMGSRYFANDAEVSGHPIESLADRYLKRVPTCPTKGDWETSWADYVIGMVNRNQAQGIITLLIRFCLPHLCYYPDVKREWFFAPGHCYQAGSFI